MLNPNLPESELLKTLLEPLLEDFQFWFSEARSLLEEEDLSFLKPKEQADLLESVKQTQQEVSAAKSLFKATNGQVGVETSTLTGWHQLVLTYWQVMSQFRSGGSTKTQPGI